MADILIRGMEMPKTCSDCPCFVWDVNAVSSSPILSAQNNGTMVCAFTREEIWNPKRGDLCPLVPLPEGHGRLGDLDALQEEFKKSHDGKRLMLIDTAPTIVPAEGGGEDGRT